MFHFLDVLFPPRDNEKRLRETSLDQFLMLEKPWLVTQTRPASVSLLPFHEPVVRAALHEAKYHGQDHAFAYLAAVLADYLRERDAPVQSLVLVPIPLSTTRLRARGYNQVEEVVRRALTELDDPTLVLDTSLLMRTRETITQVSLPRHEREENMRGAFMAQRTCDTTSSYLIIDDVLTTGATLQAALNALRDAGAQNLSALALAH